jgi:hypothetical protein
MIRRTFHAEDELEAAALEQALAMVRELRQIADAAPDGKVLAIVERAAVDRGRRFTRDRLQDALNAQAGALEQKGGAPGPVPGAGPGPTGAAPSGGSSPPPAT